MNREDILMELDLLKNYVEFTESLILSNRNHVHFEFFSNSVKTILSRMSILKEGIQGDYMSKVYDTFLEMRSWSGAGYTHDEAMEDIFETLDERENRLKEENEKLKEEICLLQKKLQMKEKKD